MIGCLDEFSKNFLTQLDFFSFSLCVCVLLPILLRSHFRRIAIRHVCPPPPSSFPSLLLPARLHSEKSKRRTRALTSTLEPRWNQTFLYSHLRRSELRSRFLEITVWDSDRLDTGRLIGEVRGGAVLAHFFFFFFTFLSLSGVHVWGAGGGSICL